MATNKKTLIELFITGAGLLLLLLIFSSSRIMSSKGPITDIKTFKADNPDILEQNNRENIENEAVVVFKELPIETAQKDPFNPKIEKIITNSNNDPLDYISLTGISILDKNKFAIIDNEAKRIGDVVYDAILIEINKDHIVLQKNEKKIIIKLK